MKVLFLPTASWNDPPSRYRILQYLKPLEERGFFIRVRAGVPDYIYERFAPYRGFGAKAVFFGLGVLSRLANCLGIWQYDAIFIQRLVLPHVFPFPELLLCQAANLLRKRVIFDFDDAIFATSPHRTQTPVERFTDRRRVARVIFRCDAVIAGNSYLASYARRYNGNVSVIPTTVDVSRYPVKQIEAKGPHEPHVIGWIGMPGSLPFLNMLKPVFQAVAARHKIIVRIVGGRDYHCPGVEVEHLPWSLDQEVGRILSFDIGVMPLSEHEEARGKCGLKLLQYMAAGIPAVASPVSANNDIVTDGVDGYLAAGEQEWIEKLCHLIEFPRLRREMGRQGRETVERRYSLQTNLPRLAGVIRGAGTEADPG